MKTMAIFLQHLVDSSVIFGVVILNAIVGCIQEGKAESALNALRELLSPQASVQRDARRGQDGGSNQKISHRSSRGG